LTLRWIWGSAGCCWSWSGVAEGRRRANKAAVRLSLPLHRDPGPNCDCDCQPTANHTLASQHGHRCMVGGSGRHRLSPRLAQSLASAQMERWYLGG
jgi:hypothetical protein